MTMVASNPFGEFLQDFLVESAELLQAYEDSLLDMERKLTSETWDPDAAAEDVQAIFRSVHTIKSLSGMMGFTEVNRYTHEAEDLLDLVRSGRVAWDAPLIAMLFRILDTVKALIHGVQSDPPEAGADVASELEPIRALVAAAGRTPSAGVPAARKDAAAQAVVSTEGLARTRTVRVDTGRIDDLLTTVAELVIAKNRVSDWHQGLSKTMFQEGRGERPEDGDGIMGQLKRLIGQLQDHAMKLRMVPVGFTFRKFHRLVRDVGQATGKDVTLELFGEETEVDRGIIELMEDPILHILRNAVDHGIETPEARSAAGKPPGGIIRLGAYQENNMIVLEISDDGRGLDTQGIYRKAVEKGLIEPSQNLTERDILNLIFLPGFSTASQVTDVSGRGVGMDVVKRNLVKLNGIVEIRNRPGSGSTFVMKLPLTLAIIQALLVVVRGEHFAIPISHVMEILRRDVSDMQWINGHRAVALRDELIPVLPLGRVLGGEPEPDGRNKPVVVCGFAEQRIGFIVDELRYQQDIVIKPLGTYLDLIHGLSGATILGDGQVCLVLDLASMWEKELGARAVPGVSSL